MDLMGWSLFLLAAVSASGLVFSIGWLGFELLQPRGRDVAQRLADLQTAPLPHVDLQLLKHRPLSHVATSGLQQFKAQPSDRKHQARGTHSRQ